MIGRTARPPGGDRTHLSYTRSAPDGFGANTEGCNAGDFAGLEDLITIVAV